MLKTKVTRCHSDKNSPPTTHSKTLDLLESLCWCAGNDASGLGLFDVIWSWKFENTHKLTCQLISHSRHGTMIKSASLKRLKLFQCWSNYSANQAGKMTLIRSEREMFSGSQCQDTSCKKWKLKSKCQDTSCHVQTLIWDLLNWPDQVVLFQSIGVCVL